MEKHYYGKQKEIAKLTDNKISDINKSYNIVFDTTYLSKVLSVIESDKKILMAHYEILGYSNNNKWTWAHKNKYIEEYLTEISKKIHDKIVSKDVDVILKQALYYSDEKWILKRTIGDKKFEYLILTSINQIE